MPRGAQPGHHRSPVFRAPDRLGANHGKPAADRQQHVGVIDRLPVRVECLESREIIAQHLRKLAQHVEIRARRQAGECDAVDPVEYQAAGSLQILGRRLTMGQVDGSRRSKAALPDDLLHQVLPPLLAPIGRHHGIQNHRAVPVKAHPIVGKDRVGLGRRGGILAHDDLDAGAGQSRGETVEFAQGEFLRLRAREARDVRAGGRAAD